MAASLVVGTNAGASGSYDLGGGELSALSEVVGNSGTAGFTQSGGTHSISTSRREMTTREFMNAENAWQRRYRRNNFV